MFLTLVLACSDYEIQSREYYQTFTQETPAELDLLIAMDSSGSMLGMQAEIGGRFTELVGWFEALEIDYQIGVITLDMESSDTSGRIQGEIITPETADPEAAFAQALNVGTDGSRFERGLDAALEAVSPALLAGDNAGFLRDDAYLGAIFVSDEDDGSLYPVDTYIRAFQDLKDDLPRGSVVLSAIAGDVPDGCADPPIVDRAYAGWRYQAIADATDGVFASICDDDIDLVLDQIGQKTSRLRDTFELAEDRYPLSDTLEVWVEEADWTDGWFYSVDLHAIVFDADALPGGGERITVRYDLSAGTPTEDIYPGDTR